jgi:CRISPR/Cas system-associated protein Cas10 (large subunit of type III CRISPR-Cas system)
LIYLQEQRDNLTQALGKCRLKFEIHRTSTRSPHLTKLFNRHIYQIINHIETVDSEMATLLGEPHL